MLVLSKEENITASFYGDCDCCEAFSKGNRTLSSRFKRNDLVHTILAKNEAWSL